MKRQQIISQQILQNRTGQTLEVLIDDVNTDAIIACSYADAPEIDGKIFIETGNKIKPRDIVNVTIEESDEYDLHGIVAVEYCFKN